MISHAYIIESIDTNSAKSLAVDIQGSSLDNNPDIYYVKGTKQSGIGVDDIREQIIKIVNIKPFTYRYKVFIIEKAETLLVAAQNSLLKIIEEPVPYAVFLFQAEHINNFLPTFLSRCIIKRDKLEKPHDRLAHEIYESLKTADKLGAVLLYERIKDLSKQESYDFLDTLCILYGDKIREKILAGQKVHSVSEIDIITHTKKTIAGNGNSQLAMELMLLKICCILKN